MPDAYKRHTLTAALPYANGPVHIGHLAGVYVPADIYARYLRSRGEDVLFVCGSDEHGIPITIRARKEGKTPAQVVEEYHQLIKKSFETFGISFTIYSRTSSAVHQETASDFFRVMYDKGLFEEKRTEQYFDETEGQFLADRYIQGTCPTCGFEQAYGDQCEQCGSSLTPDELINPRSMLSGASPVKKETTHWYLPLQDYEAWLRQWILKDHKEWKPNVYGQCKSWLDQGLQSRPMTRDLDWGVPVPLPDTDGKVLYVWFDAPIGYISATKEWADETAQDWKPWWQDKDTRLVHFIGKDNIVFHCIIFPVMLHSHGTFIVPDNVPANEFLNLEGNKISTSRNWAVWLHEYLEDFPGKQDILRYVLTANAPETKDNDFTWSDFQARNNNELVAIFGNFIHRTLVLTHKHFDGQVPEAGTFYDLDKQLIEQINRSPEVISERLDQFKFREALNAMLDLARQGNKYLADTEPWKLIKSDANRVATILHLSVQLSANLAILCEPFLPFTAKKLGRMLNLENSGWNEAGSSQLISAGHHIEKAELLFEKIEDEEVEKQMDKLMKTREANETSATSEKPACQFDDFTRLDLRIVRITQAESVPKSNKLLKLKVDTGYDTRVVVSGIAKQYSPGDIIGKDVVMLVNLAPKKIMGIPSQGMILMAENAAGEMSFLTPEQAGITPGSSIQ